MQFFFTVCEMYNSTKYGDLMFQPWRWHTYPVGNVVTLHYLTTASPPRYQRPVPLSLNPSLPAPSPLTVLPLYLPPCAPSHPIEIVEGVMITASQAHTIHTIKIG